MLDKTYRPAEVEARIYAEWEAGGAFAPDPGSAKRPYTIMIPPPNVTGSLHMGHALNSTIQDVLIRYHRMRGRDALWQPGMDHAGIATQMVVERQLEAQGESRKKLGRARFVETVWQWKAESGGAITRQLRRLGASCDWSRERFTMDPGLSQAVVKVFVDLYKKGLIYKDKRLVNWDPKLHTAISDLEVEQTEVQGHLWHIRYPIEGQGGEGQGGRHIVVATTRPETLLGDSGVAVHPEDSRYADLVGKFAVLPLVGRRLLIVADPYADPETGSGAVKITPAHDFNDFEVGRRHDLEIINIFDRDASLNRNVPEKYRGLDRFAARKAVLADLKAEGLIQAVDDHFHVVPHGDRSGVPIEPWLTDQWYADAASLAKPAIAAVEAGRIKFVPKQWENTYFEWMRNIQPWCISRQLWWGHQIPAWYGPDGAVFVETDEATARDAAREHYGKEVELRRDEDVLDTWFSSALWPFSTLGWPEDVPEVARYYPGDVLVTAFDIIFFWVARMIMMGLHFMEEAPFRTVYIHALVRDQDGKKMSKSKGNAIDPLRLIDKYGCDALRFTLAALLAPGRDVRLSESRVEGYRNFVTKLWNAARYCLMNGAVLDPKFKPENCSGTLNRWVIGKVVGLGRDLETALGSYRFDEAAAALYGFIWHEFCDWYLEFTKPILTGDDLSSNDPGAAAETRAVMGWTLARLLHLLHPFMPFVTEELWAHLNPARQAGALISAEWPSFDQALIDPAAGAEIDWVIRLVSEIRGLRSEAHVPPTAKPPLLLRDGNKVTRARLETHREIIARLARLDGVEASQAPVPKGALQIVVEEATAVLPLSQVMDLDQERDRLAGEIRKVEAEIAKLDKKLANRQFLAKAPPEVVETQKDRRAKEAQLHEKLTAAMARLAG